ncbi:MAG: hypothetical protein WC895_02760, partial [Candidatus Shapirobacteria bacterium]
MFFNKKFFLFFLLLLAVFRPSIVNAATVFNDSFEDTNNIFTSTGVGVSGGSLMLTSDGVTYSENFDSYGNGETIPDWTDVLGNWSIQNGQYNYPSA